MGKSYDENEKIMREGIKILCMPNSVVNEIKTLIFKSGVLYGAETWPLDKHQVNKWLATESIFGAGHQGN